MMVIRAIGANCSPALYWNPFPVLLYFHVYSCQPGYEIKPIKCLGLYLNAMSIINAERICDFLRNENKIRAGIQNCSEIQLFAILPGKRYWYYWFLNPDALLANSLCLQLYLKGIIMRANSELSCLPL